MTYLGAAHPSINLSLDKSHIVLQDGYTDNLTLTIHNNGTSIESYNISLDLTGLSSVWNVTSVNQTVDNVLPTFSKDTTFVIRLDTGAVPSDSGSFVIEVREPDANISSNISVQVSVEPSYDSSVSFASMNGPFQKMHAGTSMNYTVDVWNDGNVEDTVLLNVDVEPDLAAFWNNWNSGGGNNSGGNNTGGNNTGGNNTGGNNTGGNNTGGNNTGGNNTGGNNTGGNNTGGNNTGGNNTGNNSNTSVFIPANVLMFGNSYISTNNLDALLHNMLNVSGQNNNTQALTGGGLKLSQHWDNVNTSSDSWNTTLRDNNVNWDFVVLQDQSQVPGFNHSSSLWIESRDGAVNLAEAIEDESSEAMLMMTWGRRNGDPTNALIYSNFTNMQNRLEQGYVDFRDNMSTSSRDVWIAPVGLAYKHLHDSINLSGLDPTQSGNTFYDLYTADGSHPSLSGSYLAACVLYASMTGQSPVDSNDTVSLAASLKLELQQAAAATVFNETSHLSYPWQETSGTSIGPMSQSSKAIPSGWNLVFSDSELTNIPAASSVQSTLQVSVPSDATPGFYGFNLFSASTKGNVSSYSTMVIEVVAENEISAVFLDQDADFIPGQTSQTTVQVTNLGNAVLDMDWTVEVLSGPCNISLLTTSSNGFAPDDIVDIDLQVIVDGNSNSSDECVTSLGGSALFGEQEFIPPNFNFTIGIDEKVEFELSVPEGGIDITPGSASPYEIRLNNTGSEEVEFFLDIGDSAGLTTTLTSSTGVTVAAGSVGIWALESDADSGMVGMYSQLFSVTYSGVIDDISLDVNVLEVASVSLTGPIDGRISTMPGQTVYTDLELSNIGTKDLDLDASVLGLPTGAQVSFDPISSSLLAGESIIVNMTVTMASTAQSGVHSISVSYNSPDTTASLSLELQIADSVGVTVNSVTSNVAAGPLNAVDYSFEITNLGSAQDTFFITLTYDDSNNATSWFEVILSTTSVSLSPSSTQAVSMSIRERAIGAPQSGVPVDVHISSSNDNQISDMNSLIIYPIQVSAQMTILEDDDSSKPGEEISGSVVVTNTGTGIDQFMLTTPGTSCGLSEIFTLDAGASSQAFSWSCSIANDSVAGIDSLTFRVTSGARTNYVLEEVEYFTVEPTWGISGIVEMTFGDEMLTMSSSGGSSTTFTIRNLANAPISGNLFLLGSDESLFDSSLTPLGSNSSSNEFTLGNGEYIIFELLLNSRITESESASLSLSANIELDGTSYSQDSTTLEVEIEGPELPPQGVDLLFGIQLDKSQTLSAMIGGWTFSILLLMLMNTLRKRRNRSKDFEDEVTGVKEKKEKDVVVHTLGHNECRMSSDNKVICPSCDAKLGVPRGSVPPFKFTCPKCETKIRVVENQKF